MTRCEKLPCPDVPPCGPNDPVEEFVLCCPKCRPGMHTFYPMNVPSLLSCSQWMLDLETFVNLTQRRD